MPSHSRTSTKRSESKVLEGQLDVQVSTNWSRPKIKPRVFLLVAGSLPILVPREARRLHEPPITQVVVVVVDLRRGR